MNPFARSPYHTVHTASLDTVLIPALPQVCPCAHDDKSLHSCITTVPLKQPAKGDAPTVNWIHVFFC